MKAVGEFCWIYTTAITDLCCFNVGISILHNAEPSTSSTPTAHTEAITSSATASPECVGAVQVANSPPVSKAHLGFSKRKGSSYSYSDNYICSTKDAHSGKNNHTKWYDLMANFRFSC